MRIDAPAQKDNNPRTCEARGFSVGYSAAASRTMT